MHRLSTLAAAAWTFAILAACTIPGTSLPSTTLWEYDKLGHFVLFAVFGWLWMRALAGRRRALAVALAAGVAFAVGTEVYQGLLPWPRSPDPYDALADVAGLLAGVLAFRWRGEQLSA